MAFAPEEKDTYDGGIRSRTNHRAWLQVRSGVYRRLNGGDMSNLNSNSGGIGFVGLLTILFIGLKLTGYVTWSWFWILSPIWISLVLGAVLFGLILFAVIAGKKLKW